MAKMTSNDVKFENKIKILIFLIFLIQYIMPKRGISHFHAISIEDFKILAAKYNTNIKSDAIMTSLLRQIVS